jgi:glycosyltransferase involved in cell wall biosynthesis
MKSLKILQVIDILNVGGAERVYIDMCNILASYNENITSLFLVNKGVLGNQINSKIPFFELQRKNKWSIKSMFQCAKIIRQHDIIHCHFRHVYRYITLVSIIFFLKKKIILHDHYGSIDLDKKVPFLFKSFLKPNFYIGVSQTLTNWAKTELKINIKNVYLLQNIIIKQNYDIPIVKKNDFILVSNIKQVKNNLFAIELAKKCNSSLLLIGNIQDFNYYNKIELELNNKITINTSITNTQEVLNQAKIGLHTSFSETGPLVLIEYLAQNLPFLSYDTGEVAQILKKYYPEFFIDNFDINQWEKRINLIINKKYDIMEMQNIFQKHFGQESYYNNIMNIYLCIIN